MSSDELLEPAESPVDVTTLITAVNNLTATGSDTALIKSLEHLKSSCTAAHATLTHAFTAGNTPTAPPTMSPPTSPAAASPGRSPSPATNPATAAAGSSPGWTRQQ